MKKRLSALNATIPSLQGREKQQDITAAIANQSPPHRFKALIFGPQESALESKEQSILQADKLTNPSRPTAFGRDMVTPSSNDRAVLFRARFAARHVSRLGRLIFALLCRVSLAYRQVSGVPHGAKSSKVARPILLGCGYRIGLLQT